MPIPNTMKANAAFAAGDYAEALAIYREGAKMGLTRSIFNYAYCLQCGYGTEKDPAGALDLYSHLRYEEDGDAAYNAGAMLITGQGVPCDLKKGYDYMVSAAECGCIEAQMYVAMVNLMGYVGEPSVPSIRRIPFHQPDRVPDRPLLEPLREVDGTMHDRRFEVVAADEDRAMHFIKMAARNESDYTGNTVGDAEFLLAKCADEGVGCMMDHDKAVELLVRASTHGSPDAARKLRTLPDSMVDAAKARLKMGKGRAEQARLQEDWGEENGFVPFPRM